MLVRMALDALNIANVFVVGFLRVHVLTTEATAHGEIEERDLSPIGRVRDLLLSAAVTHQSRVARGRVLKVLATDGTLLLRRHQEAAETSEVQTTNINRRSRTSNTFSLMGLPDSTILYRVNDRVDIEACNEGLGRTFFVIEENSPSVPLHCRFCLPFPALKRN